ncbi:DUF4850 domain-containing protein [Dyella sedimenti]|uniref:DUF4850 domain-containing protein n=1 Tax=Dyella sedimenti TaxID=2919947 RepID=UPI001FAAE166|nr:DUF4850 domain-containing protein [Dyella sedimenti]
MRRMFRAAAAAMLCWLYLSTAQAAVGVRELRSTPDLRSAAGTDYALRESAVGSVAVTLIDVRAGSGDWVRVDAARLPPLPAGWSAAKEPPHWFYADTAGWMPVPAGWRVQRAVIGADGNAIYTFTAPEGASAGWVTYTVIPACVGCMLDEAAGLLPGAGERLAALNDQPVINLGQTNPVMSWQSRPDECTALFRYRMGGLTVRAAVLSSVPIADGKGDLSLADVYAALPERETGLADFLVGHFQQAFPACRAPNGWSG